MSKLLAIILLGLVLRLALIPFYIHPDLRGFNLAAYLIDTQGQFLTFYDYLGRLSPAHQLVRLYEADLFIYPPLAYLAPALFMKLLSPFYPWPVFIQFIYDMGQAAFHPGVAQLVFLLKFHLLVADFICLYLLLKLVGPKHTLPAAAVWLFNPVNLYATYLIGQFDIYLALFSLAALNFLGRSRPYLASAAIGIGAGFKPFPLIFLPFLSSDSSVLSRLKMVFVGLGTYFIIILSYLPSTGFRTSALFAPQSQKLFSTPYFGLGLVILLWLNLISPRSLPVWGWLGAVTLLFYSATHFHPQWFIWGLPFFVLSAVFQPSSRKLLLLLMGLYFLFVATFEPSLNTDIFRLGRLPAFSAGFITAIKASFALTSLLLVLKWRQYSKLGRSG